MVKDLLEEKIEELEEEILSLKRRVSLLEHKKSLFIEVERFDPWKDYCHKAEIVDADGRKIKPAIETT